MDIVSKNTYLKFHSDTVEFLRKKYNLDKPGLLDQVVDILQAWVEKQTHFLKKDFSRGYLERTIIQQKGSVERAKSQLDKICTLRTLMPHFFDKCDAKHFLEPLRNYSPQTILRNLTDDHYRVYISKFDANGKHSSKLFFMTYIYGVLVNEYIKSHDYCDGIIAIADFRGVNVVDAVTEINLNEMRQMATISLGGYGSRMKQIHIISDSKAIDMLVKIFKQMISTKIGNRVQVHKNIEDLYEYLPKDILPGDYGGKDKPLVDLHDEFLDELSKEENVKYLEEMRNAGTDESRRSTATFNEQYLGIAGTFKTLSVD